MKQDYLRIATLMNENVITLLTASFAHHHSVQPTCVPRGYCGSVHCDMFLTTLFRLYMELCI
jgi:hypothetical protein